MNVRLAEHADFPALVRIWHDGWHDAHAQIVPAEMTRVRTLDNFRQRVSAAISAMWVTGDMGAPLGFYVLKGDELHQLYVCERVRGTGVAAKLVSDAEVRLCRNGVELAWLACAIGNHRAARFYEKQGWRRAGVVAIEVDTPAAGFVDATLEDVDEPVFYGRNVDEALEWVRQFLSTRTRLQGLDSQARLAALDRLRTTLAAHHRTGGVWFDSRTWIVTARRA